ncbi:MULTISPECIES: hypothetical protein [Nonomuraea]|uniref:hypothetical protein n=1 Tax=Nonomuraea TaxID=83681 RepID=UPI001C605377|nr:hypothetical protein [Nonomuraea ceibae]
MPIDFEEARVVPGSAPGTYVLVVSGSKPYANMEVRLAPLVYITQPDYWVIEVEGTLPGIGLPALAPYTVSLPLDAVLGTAGIEVAGARRRQRFDVP